MFVSPSCNGSFEGPCGLRWDSSGHLWSHQCPDRSPGVYGLCPRALSHRAGAAASPELAKQPRRQLGSPQVQRPTLIGSLTLLVRQEPQEFALCPKQQVAVCCCHSGLLVALPRPITVAPRNHGLSDEAQDAHPLGAHLQSSHHRTCHLGFTQAEYKFLSSAAQAVCQQLGGRLHLVAAVLSLFVHGKFGCAVQGVGGCWSSPAVDLWALCSVPTPGRASSCAECQAQCSMPIFLPCPQHAAPRE